MLSIYEYQEDYHKDMKFNATNYLLWFAWIIVQNILWLRACPMRPIHEGATNSARSKNLKLKIISIKT